MSLLHNIMFTPLQYCVVYASRNPLPSGLFTTKTLILLNQQILILITKLYGEPHSIGPGQIVISFANGLVYAKFLNIIGKCPPPPPPQKLILTQ